MAEKSTRIANGSSGDYLATRDAKENDSSANARTIQIYDWASRQWSASYASPTRTETVEDAADLGTDFASLDSGITSNKLTVGDQNLLVCSVHVGASINMGGDFFAIVPLVLDASNNVLGYLQPKSATPWAAGYTPIKYTSGSLTYYIAPWLAWPLNGAGPYIGIGIFGDLDLGEGNTATVKVWADLVSGQEGCGWPDSEPSSFYGQYGYDFG